MFQWLPKIARPCQCWLPVLRLRRYNYFLVIMPTIIYAYIVYRILQLGYQRVFRNACVNTFRDTKSNCKQYRPVQNRRVPPCRFHEAHRQECRSLLFAVADQVVYWPQLSPRRWSYLVIDEILQSIGIAMAHPWIICWTRRPNCRLERFHHFVLEDVVVAPACDWSPWPNVLTAPHYIAHLS
jgi:hypothetical protein